MYITSPLPLFARIKPAIASHGFRLKVSMTLYQILFTAFLVGFSGAMAPGPVLSVTISETSKRGFAAGPLVVLGHGILEFILVIALALGASRFVGGEGFLQVVSVAGGFVLFWMGTAMAVRVIKGTVAFSTAGKRQKESPLGPVSLGGITSLANPFWYIWWATIGLTYILQSLRYGKVGISVFFAGHILSDLVWFSLVAFVVAFGKRFLSDQVYRALTFACGAFLIGMGIYFLRLGIRGG